jgi:hypothetical protein
MGNEWWSGWGAGDTPILFTMETPVVEEPWVGADVDLMCELHPSWSRWFAERVCQRRDT